MINKNSLLHLVNRARRGALLDGEADILRDAIELLDEMAMTLDALGGNVRAESPSLREYAPCDTQSFSVADVRRGRPAA